MTNTEKSAAYAAGAKRADRFMTGVFYGVGDFFSCFCLHSSDT
jgi:hypothetical protein